MSEIASRREAGFTVRRSGLTALETAIVHVSTALVGGTGIVYAVMRYLLEPTDPFAVVNHPWQPAVQHLHVVLAPALVFAAGVLWRSHALVAWRQRGTARRRSGTALIVTTLPMIATGVLVQVAYDERWRQVWGGLHTVVSIAWLVSIALHLLAARIEPARRPGPRSSVRPGSP